MSAPSGCLFPACSCYRIVPGQEGVVPDKDVKGAWCSTAHSCELDVCEWPKCVERGQCVNLGEPRDGFAACAMARGVYPLTIIADRYGGTYSGGKFLAWNLNPEHVPTSPSGSNLIASEFWRHYPGVVGKGDTPAAAISSLREALRESVRPQDIRL